LNREATGSCIEEVDQGWQIVDGQRICGWCFVRHGGELATPEPAATMTTKNKP
jgi:hypothetical protein